MRLLWPGRCRRLFAQPAVKMLSLLVLALLLFLVGTLAPMITVRRLIVLQESFSLLTGLLRLYQDGEYMLFVIILVFSVLFPVAKICLLFGLCRKTLWRQASSRTLLHWLVITGKWSMMDVFIVALLVVVGKVHGLSEVQVHYGLYAFAAAVLLIHFTAFRLETMVQHDDQPDVRR